MRIGFKITCPNKHKSGRGTCGRTLKIVDRLISNQEEILYCISCGAQCHLKYNEFGACKIEVPSLKVRLDTRPYPATSEGIFAK